MSNKVNIFAVAANDGIKKTIEEVASERNDIEITIRIGNLSTMVDLIEEIEAEKFDIIIARGLTADSLIGKVGLPVVKLGFSGYDILSAIRIAQEYNRKFAIVGFEELITGAELICNLIQYKAKRVTVNCEEEIKEAIFSLKSEGYKIMVGGTLTASIAEKMGLNGILVSSGQESVEIAVQHAVDIHNAYANKTNEVITLKSVMERIKTKVLIFDEKGNQKFKNFDEDYRWVDSLGKLCNKVITNGELSLVKKIDGTEYIVKGFKTVNDDKGNVVFMIEEPVDSSVKSQEGIRIINYGDINIQLPDIIYDSSEYMSSAMENAREYSKSQGVLLIHGEEGTEKTEFALYVFKNFVERINLLMVIDAELTDKKGLDIFINKYGDLINNKEVAVYIKNVEYASREVERKLLSFIHENKDLRYIISIDGNCLPKLRNALNNMIFDQDVNILEIPPLRERTNDIINHVNFYISLLNIRNSKKVIGLEHDAATMVKKYPWPNNIRELKNMIVVAIKKTESFYISKELVEVAINEGKLQVQNKNKRINLNGKLEQIEKEIVKIVLEEENGSRIKTAERLGISRSKLWNTIKKIDESDF